MNNHFSSEDGLQQTTWKKKVSFSSNLVKTLSLTEERKQY